MLEETKTKTKTQHQLVNILVVDPKDDLPERLQQLLGHEPDRFRIFASDTIQALDLHCLQDEYDVILTAEYSAELASVVSACSHRVPVVLIDFEGQYDSFVEQYGEALFDYLSRDDINSGALIRVIRHAIRINHIRQEYTQEIEASNRTLSVVLEKNADGVLIVDAEGYIRFINPAAEELFGQDGHSLTGTLFGFPVIQGERTELELVNRDKGIIYAEMRVVKTEWNERPAFLISLRDITDRKRNEMRLQDLNENLEIMVAERTESLKQSELQLRLVTDALPALISFVDTELRYEFANKAYEDWFGLKPEAILGKTMSDILGEEMVSSVRPYLDRAFAGEVLSYETLAPYKHNGSRHIRVNYVPHFSEKGSVDGLYVMVADISERIEAEEALRESEERFRFAMNAAGMVGTWDWNIQTDLMYSDARFAVLFSVDPEKAEKGTPIADFIAGIHPDDRERIVQAVQETIETGNKYSEEYRLLQKDGTIRWVIVQGECLYDAEGKPWRFPGAAVDITERKKMEFLLEGQKQALEQAVNGEPLAKVLETIAKTAEIQSSDRMFASVLLMDKDGKHLRHGAAPSLPHWYNELVDGVAIGPEVGTCGRAAYIGEEVVVSDMATHPHWAPFKDATQSLGLLASWSTPIFSSKGHLLGTFGVYFSKVQEPTDDDREVVTLLSRTAGLVIEWHQDITERKLSEQALAESEEKFRALADNIPNLAWMANPDGWIFWYNNRWYEYTGTTPEQMEGWGWQSVHDPDVLSKVMEKWRYSIESGKSFEMVFPLKGSDGLFRQFLTRVEPIWDQQGNVVRWFGTNTDITRQLEIEAALQRSETRLKSYSIQQDAMADFSLQAMTGVDDMAEITRIAVKMVADTLGTGYSKVLQRVPGTECDLRILAVHGFEQGLVGQTFDSEMEPHTAVTLKTCEPIIVEDIHQETRLKPSPLHVEYGLTSGVTVIIYAHGKPFGVLEADSVEKRLFTEAEVNFMQTAATLIGTVIERKLNEEAMARQHELMQDYARRLEASNKDLAQFASIVSHDLQAPLRKLFLFGDFLKQNEMERLSGEGRDYIDRMQRSLARMQSLITDLLALSRVDRLANPFTHTDFQQLVSTVLEELAVEIKQTGATVTLGAMCAFEADSQQMLQMMMNLLQNALKYRRKDVAPTIGIACEEIDSNQVRITVADNGIGIKPEHYEKIFEIFQRLHNEREYSGTGIGLAIVKRIVDRHKGTITLDSKPNEGTRFFVTLPKHQLL